MIIKKSPLHGVGVFSQFNYRAGDLLTRWSCVDVGSVESFGEHLPTVGVIEEGRLYCPTANAPFPLWAVNWSKDPNIGCTPTDVFALRSIRAGDEMTINYYKEPDAKD